MNLLGAGVGGGSSGGIDPGNVDLSGAEASATGALDRMYGKLGVGGGTAQATDDAFMGRAFGTQQTALANEANQANFQLSTAQNNQPSGLLQLAGLLGGGLGL